MVKVRDIRDTFLAGSASNSVVFAVGVGMPMWLVLASEFTW
jgi:hypothetical protein